MIPRYDEMYSNFLKIISNGNVFSLEEIRSEMMLIYNLNEQEKTAKTTSGSYIFNNRVSWTASYLKKAGLINTPSRGKYSITERGRSVLQVPLVDNDYLSKFTEFNDFINKPNKVVDGCKLQYNPNKIEQSKTPAEMMDIAFSQINETLSDELLSEISQITPSAFEQLVVDLLISMGYGDRLSENGLVTQSSIDEGIDGIIKEDKLGFDNIYIQAKKWDPSASIGRPEIQKFVGALMGQGGNKGLFITTAKFTKEAQHYAKNSPLKVVLIDGSRLTRLMVEHNVGVSVLDIYSIKRIDSDYFYSI